MSPLAWTVLGLLFAGCLSSVGVQASAAESDDRSAVAEFQVSRFADDLATDNPGSMSEQFAQDRERKE